jgi:hypothetical protein
MALLSRDNGWQNGILRCVLMDNTSTTGGALIGLANNSSGLLISTIADVEATPIVYSAAGATIDTVATLGTYAAPAAGHCRFQQVDATNHPGLYELQFLNSRFAVGNASYLIVTIAAAGSHCSPQSFVVDLDAQVDTTAFGGATGFFAGGIPQVNIAQILGIASNATKLANELAGRVTGTVTNATFAPTTTQAEFADITTAASFSVFINRGFLVTSGAMINMGGVVLGDIVGTSGRRLTFSAMPQAFANGDTIQIM